MVVFYYKEKNSEPRVTNSRQMYTYIAIMVRRNDSAFYFNVMNLNFINKKYYNNLRILSLMSNLNISQVKLIKIY